MYKNTTETLEDKTMRNSLNELDRYFKETPKEKIKEDIEYIDNLYKNTTETNLKLGEIKPCDTLLRLKIEQALKRAEIRIKRYNPDYWLSDNVRDEMIRELLKELK